MDVWVANILAKLIINADYYKNKQTRMYYIYTRITGNAQEHLNPCYLPSSTNFFIIYNEILDLLTKIYTNP
jgi:hypothetical protein